MPKSTHKQTPALIKRSPVIAIMGHIDHGKSTLLDYIRKTKVTEGEAGGITQHLGAYEVVHKSPVGVESKITFLDTPGHEAFEGIRTRGASVADVAILVVSAEEGVKPQTLEAMKSIVNAKIPYIVAINKIDSPKADLERTKQSLAEHEIYLEGYGGQIPWTAISGKSGAGISELLDLVLLVAELAELKGDSHINAEGIVIEGHLDAKRGISSMLLIKNGSLKQGQTVVSGKSLASLRNIENFAGEKIVEATFSSPVTVIGWSTLPKVGDTFHTFSNKKEAETYIEKTAPDKIQKSAVASEDASKIQINIILKADTAGSLEAIVSEIKKIKSDMLLIKIVRSDVGEVSLGDIQSAGDLKNVFVLGFNAKIDLQAKNLAERSGITIHIENIIYKLVEWLKKEMEALVPKINVEEARGKAKILKVFSRNKNKQIVGGRVEDGTMYVGEEVKIFRREAEIGKGKIRGLEQQKTRASEAKKDTEFGAEIQCQIEIVPGDKIEGFKIIQK
ncbi:MAG: translation initiation factor IF-2 [Candidatus Taylorbacteria bacterium]